MQFPKLPKFLRRQPTQEEMDDFDREMDEAIAKIHADYEAACEKRAAEWQVTSHYLWLNSVRQASAFLESPCQTCGKRCVARLDARVGEKDLSTTQCRACVIAESFAH